MCHYIFHVIPGVQTTLTSMQDAGGTRYTLFLLSSTEYPCRSMCSFFTNLDVVMSISSDHGFSMVNFDTADFPAVT